MSIHSCLLSTCRFYLNGWLMDLAYSLFGTCLWELSCSLEKQARLGGLEPLEMRGEAPMAAIAGCNDLILNWSCIPAICSRSYRNLRKTATKKLLRSLSEPIGASALIG